MSLRDRIKNDYFTVLLFAWMFGLLLINTNVTALSNTGMVVFWACFIPFMIKTTLVIMDTE